MTDNARKSLRDKLLGVKHEPDSRILTLFGEEIEFRQPSFRAVMEARNDDDEISRAARMIIQYAMVPGTEERVFEESDLNTIMEWPFGKDLMDVQNAIADLTGIDISGAEQEIQSDPLSDSQ